MHLAGCNCKRSGCNRGYCECFQLGVRCSERCKCCECSNPAGQNPGLQWGGADTVDDNVSNDDIDGSLLHNEVTEVLHLGCL